MKKGVFISLLAFLVACSNKPNSRQEYHSSIVADEQNEQSLKESLKDVEHEERERRNSLSSILFERLEHDYGDIVADADYKTSFVFKNNGTKPLQIYDVKASCGCTVPSWNKKAILPGATDEIEVSFHPKKLQTGSQHKTISVMTNTEPGITILQIKANVSSKK